MDEAVLKAVRLEYATTNTPLLQLCRKYKLNSIIVRHHADKEGWDKEREAWIKGKTLPEAALPPMNVTIPTPNAVFRAHLENNLLFFHNQSPVLRELLTSVGKELKRAKDPMDLQRLATAYEKILTAFRTINGIMAPGFTKKTHKQARQIPTGTAGNALLPLHSTEIIDPDGDTSFLDNTPRPPDEDDDSFSDPLEGLTDDPKGA